MSRPSAVLLGTAAEAALLAVAAFVPLPRDVVPLAPAFVLVVGGAGGYVAGSLSSDGRRARRNGTAVGLVGGLALAVFVFGAMGNALPRARWSAVWAVEYAVAAASGGVVPPALAARYDAAIAAVVASLAGLAAVLSSVAGAVVAS